MKKAVLYINQFFAGIGGEEQADQEPIIKEGAVGPGLAINQMSDAEVTHTIICGDNFMGSREEEAKEIIAKAHIEAKKLVERDVITETAKKKADRIIKNAEEEARKLKNGAINFSREILSAMTTDITKFLDVLLKNNEELKGMIVEPKTEEKEKKGK